MPIPVEFSSLVLDLLLLRPWSRSLGNMAARKGPCTGSQYPGPVPTPGPRLPQGRDARLPGPESVPPMLCHHPRHPRVCGDVLSTRPGRQSAALRRHKKRETLPFPAEMFPTLSGPPESFCHTNVPAGVLCNTVWGPLVKMIAIIFGETTTSRQRRSCD